jgi:hypothetical protein
MVILWAVFGAAHLYVPPGEYGEQDVFPGPVDSCERLCAGFTRTFHITLCLRDANHASYGCTDERAEHHGERWT